MEAPGNRTVDAALDLQQENSLALSCSQNHLVLVMLTPQQGGVCALIHTTYCTNVNKSQQIKHDIPCHFQTFTNVISNHNIFWCIFTF